MSNISRKTKYLFTKTLIVLFWYALAGLLWITLYPIYYAYTTDLFLLAVFGPTMLLTGSYAAFNYLRYHYEVAEDVPE